MNIELIGFIGSAVIALSLIMSNIKRLRLFNLFGCIIMVIYGFHSELQPIILINIFCISINLFHLIEYKADDDYK